MSLLGSPYGSTRTHVDVDHALIATDGHVRSPLVHWKDTFGVVLISPAMGCAPRGPRFVQDLAHTTDASETHAAGPGIQRLIYVLEGRLTLDGHPDPLVADDYAWFPPGDTYRLRGEGKGKVLVFEKPYAKPPALMESLPCRIVGKLADVPAEPFMGDEDARLSTLLPIEPVFDMAVNVFEYQSGATLPFVETHVMEHGLYMRSGQGVYRLNQEWYPVCQGDTIWMAAYCPQWFVAMGKGPASYIYYKDIHRDPFAT